MSLAALRALFLATALLLAQLGAFAHALEHLPDAGGAPEPACEWCAAYAPLGAGAPVAAPPPIVVAPQPLPVTVREPGFLSAQPLLAYRAQAPPLPP